MSTEDGLTISQGANLPAACDPDSPQTHSLFFKNATDAEGAFGLYAAVGSGQWAPIARTVDSQGRATIVSDSTSETTLYSAAIPADALGVTKVAHVMVCGAYKNTTGANQTIRIRVKFGGATVYDDTSPVAASNANERGFRINLWLRNNGSTNSNVLGGVIDIGGTGAATAGSGDLASDEILSTALVTTPTASTIDTTSDQTFEITVQLSTATAGATVRRDIGQTVI
jgi:hypothetical protein